MLNKTKSPQFLTSAELEKQENLTSEMLKNLFVPKFTELPKPELIRPQDGFIDLMNWAEQQFCNQLKDQINLNKFVHNRIIIDGQFVEFAKQNNTIIKCLYKDSLISWKTETDQEKFFGQGAFLVKNKNTEFLIFSLFAKGSNFEDEVNFFVIVSEKNYQSYVSLRNSFDEWVQQRDRGNLHIRVIDGEDIPYTKDNTWEELFLPKDLKIEVKDGIENFLASKDFYLKNRIPWKKGLLLYGPPGNGKSSIIKTIISNYNFKPITIAAGANDDALRDAFSYAEEQSPALLYFEDIDSLLERSIDPSTFLNLMDGVRAVNGLFIVATANEVKKLKANITDRPSRFDRKIEIPLPTAAMSLIYLQKWFGNLFPEKKYKELASLAEKNRFSYAYLKELYISTMFQALSANRQKPIVKDIDSAIKIIMKDKNALAGKTINTDQYFN